MPDLDDLDLMHALAFFYWRHNQIERAAALAYGAFRLGKADAKLLSLLALVLLDLGLPDRAVMALEDIDGTDDPAIAASIHYIRARALLRLGERDRAREEFKRGLVLSMPPLSSVA